MLLVRSIDLAVDPPAWNWRQRWNRVISSALYERVFALLRRRGTARALTAAFVVSAAVHAYQATVALGGLAAVAMAMFFLVQPPLMLVERRLGVQPSANQQQHKARYFSRLCASLMTSL